MLMERVDGQTLERQRRVEGRSVGSPRTRREAAGAKR